MGLKEYIFGFSCEDKASDFLVNSGFEIVERNFHSKFGEIDIIAKKGDILHFIEVKATSKNYEAIYRISKSKISKIIKTINYFMLQSQLDVGYEIDVICVENDQIRFIQNVSF